VKFALAVAMRPANHFLPLAMAGEEHGFDTIVVPDSVFHPEQVSAPYPYTADGQRFWPPETPFVDPWVAIPAMAAVTQRIRFYSHVLKLAIRHPLLVAKTLSSAAALSDNRVALGAGLGWIPEEFAWCHTDYGTRGERMNEALEIIRLCLSGEYVEYHGKHYEFERLRMSPVPELKVPFILGGHAPAALRRAAKYGDGWTSAMVTKAQLKGYLDTLRALREEYGRSAEPFEVSVVCMDVFNAQGYRELEELGVTEIITQPWVFYGAGMNPTVEQSREGIARFSDEVIAKFR
jgi:probable F420-dependent oxidoreductase